MLDFFKRLFSPGNSPAPTPEDFKNGTLIDVRSPGEYAGGHVERSRNLPLGPKLNAAHDELRNLPKPIVTLCASGRRSGIAARQLRAAGIDAVNGGRWSDV